MFSFCCCGGTTSGHTVVTGCTSTAMPNVVTQTVTPPLSGAETDWVADTLTLGAIPADFTGLSFFQTNWWYGASSHPDPFTGHPFWYVGLCNTGSTWKLLSYYGTGPTVGNATGHFRQWTFGVGLNTRSPFFVTSSPTKDTSTFSTVTVTE